MPILGRKISMCKVLPAGSWLRRVRNRRRGFTLFELLIVLAIIGILSAIAVPVYSNYLQQTKVKAALITIRQIEKCLLLFETENGFFPDTLAQAGIHQLDPWGHPYRYIAIRGRPTSGADRVQTRMDKFLHPLNSDFDLWSMGPDGATQLPLTAKVSRDDLIRASDGAFLGVAEDF